MVGAGLSGLFTAVELLARGIDDLVVVERFDEPGGVVQTICRDGYLLEPAAGSVTLPHPHLSPIVERIGADVAEARTDTRYVYSRARLIEIPASPRALLAPLLRWDAKLRAIAEPLLSRASGPGEESLAGFSRRRFGRGGGDLLAGLLASGVYAGDPERLSAEFAFPTLTGLEEEHGSLMKGLLHRRRSRPPGARSPTAHVPVGGMTNLARAATRFLGDRFRPGFEVDALRRDAGGWVIEGKETLRADAAVVAARPEQAARLVDDELKTSLTEVPSEAVAVIGLGGAGPQPFPDGFGTLIAPGEPLLTVGILFESSYAPERAPEGSWLLKVIAGGAIHSEVVDWDDDPLVERVLTEAAAVLGRHLEPSFMAVVRHLPGIPQPEIGHGNWLARIEGLLSERQGLHLTGWGYRGVGVTQLATDAVRVAKTISRRDG